MTHTFTTSVQALRGAVDAAVLAPSVHNTQPWRFVLDNDHLDIRAEQSRRLQVLDPSARQLTISLGCAVFNARVAISASGFGAQVDRFPDPGDPDLVARLSLTAADLPGSGDATLAPLKAQLRNRQTNRRHFEDETVPDEVIERLSTAAQAEDARLFEVIHPQHRLSLALLTQQADDQENVDPAYRAELRRWTTDDPTRRDGVPSMAVPHVDGTAHDDIPIRDFDTHGAGWLPTDTRSSLDQCLLILGTDNDDRTAWLRAGEALERLWLEATDAGYAVSLFTQLIEVPYTRERLRAELTMTMHPHVLLRIGRASQTSSSNRRRLEDMLTVGH